jgi:hypothetical protein
MRLERIVRSSADCQHADAGLFGHHAAGHQLDDDVERLVEHAPLLGRLDPDLDRVVDQRARSDAEHGAAARHVVELHHAAGERERVVIGQRDDAGAEPDVAGALRRAGDEHFRAGDDLEAAGMMLADPGLVIIQPVEVDQKLHIAVETEQRIFVERMKRGEKYAGLQISVLHGRALVPSCFDAWILAGSAQAVSGLVTVNSGKRLKSRSADQSSRTPCRRHSAAIRAS